MADTAGITCNELDVRHHTLCGMLRVEQEDPTALEQELEAFTTDLQALLRSEGIPDVQRGMGWQALDIGQQVPSISVVVGYGGWALYLIYPYTESGNGEPHGTTAVSTRELVGTLLRITERLGGGRLCT